jgi:hypothetical protein
VTLGMTVLKERMYFFPGKMKVFGYTDLVCLSQRNNFSEPLKPLPALNT